MQSIGCRGLAALLPMLSAIPASAELVSLSAARDNTLFQNTIGATSNGAGQYLFCGQTMFDETRRALLKFDIATAVPAGATITSVSLRLHMSRTAAASEVATLHRVARGWGEGASDAIDEEGGGTSAEPGDATWLHTFFDTQTWVHPGGDFEPLVSAATVVVGDGFYTWGSTPQMIDDVQRWLDAPAFNHGWMLRGNEDAALTAKRFDSRENPNEANRPSLKIEYTPIPEPAAITGFLLMAGVVGRRSLTPVR